jgi:threonine synthase
VQTPSLYRGLIDKYRDRLPIGATTPAISLHEGNTPLIELDSLVRETGKDVRILVKYEGLNPTGSFKDRGMTMAVTKAVEDGSRAVICASTGNTSASAAAYAARAGITAFVLIPDGQIAMGKLAQAMMHGSVVIQIRGNFDDGMSLVKRIADRAPVTIVNSVNPFRLEGQKTAAFEIIEQLGAVPDFHCLPVGNAGNITAHWMGYCEGSGDVVVHGRNQDRPVMLGYQAAGAAPFLRGKAIENPETVATAIRIGNPQSWDRALDANQDSGGWFDEFSDTDILKTQLKLARYEGIFCEPASAISVAGALKDVASGKIPEGSTVVCTVTGHGLKDPDTAIEQCAGQLLTVDAEIGPVERAILDHLE